RELGRELRADGEARRRRPPERLATDAARVGRRDARPRGRTLRRARRRRPESRLSRRPPGPARLLHRADPDLRLHRVQPPVPLRLITTGVIGTGKTTVARLVAARAGAILIRTDAERKRLAGFRPTDKSPAGFGEKLYTLEMTRRTYMTALGIAERLLTAGWP